MQGQFSTIHPPSTGHLWGPPSDGDARRPGEQTAPVVLVVEDDVEVSAQICDLLRFRGLDPVAAYQGPEAVQLFAQHQPQVVVLDLMLPRMNGVQVLERIRRLPGGARVPVLVISAVYREPRAFERDFKRLEVREFLAKPFSPFVLAQRVDEALGRQPEEGTLQTEDRTGTSPPIGIGPTPVEADADALPDRPVPRLEFLRRLGAVCSDQRSGRLVIESGHDERVELAFRGGKVVRATTNNPGESWDRLRVMVATDREQVAYRVLLRLLDPAEVRWTFTPEWVPEAAVDLSEVHLLRALYESSWHAFDFNAVADTLSAHVGRCPVPTATFPAVFASLGVRSPLDALPSMMERRMPVERLFNLAGGHSTALVRLLWFLEQVGSVEFVRS